MLLPELNANVVSLKSWLPGWELFTFSSSQEAIRDVHVKGIMYRAVEADIGNGLWFIYYFVWANIKYITRQHLSCCQDTKNEFRNNEPPWYKNKKQCGVVCANYIRITRPFSLPLFSHLPGKYICYGEQSHAVLKKLSEQGKKMFLITNSPFDFV